MGKEQTPNTTDRRNNVCKGPQQKGRSRVAWKIQQVSSGANKTRSWKEAGAGNTAQLRAVLSILKAPGNHQRFYTEDRDGVAGLSYGEVDLCY